MFLNEGNLDHRVAIGILAVGVVVAVMLSAWVIHVFRGIVEDTKEQRKKTEDLEKARDPDRSKNLAFQSEILDRSLEMTGSDNWNEGSLTTKPSTQSNTTRKQHGQTFSRIHQPSAFLNNSTLSMMAMKEESVEF